MRTVPAMGMACLAVWLMTAGCTEEVKTPQQTQKASLMPPQCPDVAEQAPFPQAALVGIDIDDPHFRKELPAQSGESPEVIEVLPEKRTPHTVRVRYNFGRMETGQSRKYIFTITNRGDGPLVLANHSKSCSCTISKISQGALKKGETAQIELSWKADAPEPRLRHNAAICTNDPKRRLIVLEISGEVTNAVDVIPPEIWQVGTVEGSAPRIFEGRIRSRMYKEFKILGIETDDKSVQAEWTPFTRDDLRAERALSGYNIKVTVLPGRRIGPFEHRLTIKLDLHGGSRFPVRLVGTRTGPIIIRAPRGVRWNPNSMALSLGRFPAAKGAEATLLLHVDGLGDQKLRITGWQSKPGYVKQSGVLEVKLEEVLPLDRFRGGQTAPQKKTAPPDKTSPGKTPPANTTPPKKPEPKGDGKTAGTPQNGSAKKTAKQTVNRRRLYRLTFRIPPGKPPLTQDGNEPVLLRLQTNHKQAREMIFTIRFDSY